MSQKYSVATSHGLHSGYSHPLLRSWQCSTSGVCGDFPVRADNLMLPLFIVDKEDDVQPIASMPGVSRMGADSAVNFLGPLVDAGLKSVLLFAVTDMKKVCRKYFYI